MFRFDAIVMSLCVFAVCAAVAYAQFDEEFGDMIGWISRDFHYANGVQIGCGAYTCERATWSPGIGRDSADAGLRIAMGEQIFGPDDFASAATLAAKGWSMEMQNQNQGRVWMKRNEANGAWMQAEFMHGALARVFVYGGPAATISVEGQTIHLPLNRREMKRNWSAPVKVVRHNAVNGALPD